MFGLNILSTGVRFAEAVSETAETIVTTSDTVTDATEAASDSKSILSMAKDIATNPITIGIAAVTATATAGYYGWKAYKKYRAENPKSEINTGSVNQEDLKKAEEVKVEGEVKTEESTK
ncbi:MAG: hypothetical protein ACRCXT_16485 [Paraclostridium sp.]